MGWMGWLAVGFCLILMMASIIIVGLTAYVLR
jgi:hypothetical protein